MWRQGDDGWSWKLEEDEVFSVKYMYNKLERGVVGDGNHTKGENKVFVKFGNLGFHRKRWFSLENLFLIKLRQESIWQKGIVCQQTLQPIVFDV